MPQRTFTEHYFVLNFDVDRSIPQQTKRRFAEATDGRSEESSHVLHPDVVHTGVVFQQHIDDSRETFDSPNACRAPPGQVSRLPRRLAQINAVVLFLSMRFGEAPAVSSSVTI